jgi:hypothetical protein
MMTFSWISSVEVYVEGQVYHPISEGLGQGYSLFECPETPVWFFETTPRHP